MKTMTTLAALALSLAFAGASYAADAPATGAAGTTAAPAATATPAAAKSGTTAKAATKSVKGSFVSADSTANTVTLKVAGKEMTYSVSGDTKVTKGGKTATWADLKSGDNVWGTEKSEDGKDMLVSLKAAAPKMKAKPAATAAPATK